MRIHRFALLATPLFSGCLLATALGIGGQALQAVTGAGVAAGGAAANRADEEHDQGEKCALLSGAQPYISQVRLSQDGTFQFRQWYIESRTGSPKWEMLRAQGADAHGWLSERGTGNYDFKPPLQTQFNGTEAPYLISVRAEASNSTESDQELGAFAVFGTPTGVYDWRGVRYQYTIVPALPCYPQDPEP